MKGLTTLALLEVLEGSPAAKAEMRRLRGDEVAVAEASLLELAYLAARGPPRGRVARLSAIAKLRRRVTALPLDARAVEEAALQLSREPSQPAPLVFGALCALEAAGCSEVLHGPSEDVRGAWKFKSRRIGMQQPKAR